jgi:hypothetical protein
VESGRCSPKNSAYSTGNSPKKFNKFHLSRTNHSAIILNLKRVAFIVFECAMRYKQACCNRITLDQLKFHTPCCIVHPTTCRKQLPTSSSFTYYLSKLCNNGQKQPPHNNKWHYHSKHICIALLIIIFKFKNNKRRAWSTIMLQASYRQEMMDWN